MTDTPIPITEAKPEVSRLLAEVQDSAKAPAGSPVQKNSTETSDAMVKDGKLPPLQVQESALKESAPLNQASTEPAQSKSLADHAKRVQEIPQANGKLIVYDDQTGRFEFNDGSIYEKRQDGMEIKMTPDRSVSVNINGDTREAKPTFPDRPIERTEVDDRGNVTYTYADKSMETVLRGGGHHFEYADGAESLFLNGTLIWAKDIKEDEYSYDMEGNLEHTTVNNDDYSWVRFAPDGKVLVTGSSDLKREFKYDDNGQLSEFKGRLGTWKRETDEAGNTLWANQDTGAIWQGEFKVDDEGNLHYTPRRGQAYIFTRDGKDQPAARK